MWTRSAVGAGVAPAVTPAGRRLARSVATMATLSLGIASCASPPPTLAGAASAPVAGEAVIGAPRVAITFPASLRPEPVDGRVYLILSRDSAEDLRWRSYGPGLYPLFGLDVEGLRPGEAAVLSGETPGYPVEDLDALPPGEYFAQALLVPYETFRRADGHVVRFPLDRGEGQRWKIQPGSLHSPVQRVRLDRRDPVVRLELTRRTPPLPPVTEGEYVRHIRIRSELLSDFWGRDMELAAFVLLPPGHPAVGSHGPAHRELAGAAAAVPPRYPVVYLLTNQQPEFDRYLGFSPEPPAADARGWDRVSGEEAHAFYRDWTEGRHPPVLLVVIQNPTPVYRGSYGIDSPNTGPYGSALLRELIPAIERRFGGIPAGWARALYGTGTGAWHTLAWQIFHPEEFNGAWAFGPDPVGFDAYHLVDIYDDENAYHPNHPYLREPTRPYTREPNGEVVRTVRQQTRMELAFGSRTRSAEDVFATAAAFGPVGDDGYARPLWDPVTGVIDREVAEHWRRFDLTDVLRRNWDEIGPALVGKLHISVRDPDPYFRDHAVRRLETFLETTAPYYDGSITYRRDPASGTEPERLGRLRATRTVLPLATARIRAAAPAGALPAGWSDPGGSSEPAGR